MASARDVRMDQKAQLSLLSLKTKVYKRAMMLREHDAKDSLMCGKCRGTFDDIGEFTEHKSRKCSQVYSKEIENAIRREPSIIRMHQQVSTKDYINKMSEAFTSLAEKQDLMRELTRNPALFAAIFSRESKTSNDDLEESSSDQPNQPPEAKIIEIRSGTEEQTAATQKTKTAERTIRPLGVAARDKACDNIDNTEMEFLYEPNLQESSSTTDLRTSPSSPMEEPEIVLVDLPATRDPINDSRTSSQSSQQQTAAKDETPQRLTSRFTPQIHMPRKRKLSSNRLSLDFLAHKQALDKDVEVKKIAQEEERLQLKKMQIEVEQRKCDLEARRLDILERENIRKSEEEKNRRELEERRFRLEEEERRRRIVSQEQLMLKMMDIISKKE